MERRHVERITSDQVPVERLEMTDIKEDAMALGNRALAQGIGPHQREQCIGLLAGLPERAAKLGRNHVVSSVYPRAATQNVRAVTVRGACAGPLCAAPARA